MGEVHFHYGHNFAGYLPESDIGTADTFDDAKRGIIDDMLFAADHEEDETVAERLTSAAEDMNLNSGPDATEYVDIDRSIPVAYWVQACAADDCSEEEEDAY